MKIIIAADHGGFELKNILISFLEKQGYEVEDYGPYEFNDHDDYPDFVIPAMRAVINQYDSYGIIICKNGVGVSMLANKFKEIRCALSFNEAHVSSAKRDDNINVLALPAEYITEEEAKKITNSFLETPFSHADRHIKRLEKINEL